MVANTSGGLQQKVYIPLRPHRSTQSVLSILLVAKNAGFCFFWVFFGFFFNIKRCCAFLLALKDPIDLDKLNHCKCFLLTWLLFVVSIVCFHHLKAEP